MKYDALWLSTAKDELSLRGSIAMPFLFWEAKMRYSLQPLFYHLANNALDIVNDTFDWNTLDSEWLSSAPPEEVEAFKFGVKSLAKHYIKLWELAFECSFEETATLIDKRIDIEERISNYLNRTAGSPDGPK